MELQSLLQRELTSLQQYPHHPVAIFLLAWALASVFTLLIGLSPGIRKGLARAGIPIALIFSGAVRWTSG
jgi:hypothetical protein